MRIIHGKGYSSDDRKGYRSLVHSNVVMAIQGLLSGATQLDMQLSSDTNQVGCMLTRLYTATRGPDCVCYMAACSVHRGVWNTTWWCGRVVELVGVAGYCRRKEEEAVSIVVVVATVAH